MVKRASGIWIHGKPIFTSKQASDILFKGISKLRTKDLVGAKGEILIEAPTGKGVALAGGKAGLAGISLDEYIAGLRRLSEILQNKGGVLDKIMVEAYFSTVSRVIKERWEAKGGGQFRDPAGRRARGADKRGRKLGEFTTYGQIIEKLLTDKRAIIKFGKGRVGIVSLTTLRSVAEIKPTTSPFKSVFLMIELGTGRYAGDGTLVRGFRGYGSTPFKVPPGFLNTQPGDWFSRPGIAKHARQFLEDIGSESRAFQRKAPSGATIDDRGRIVKNWPLFAGGKSSKTKSEMTAEYFASKGREGRFVLLNKRGVIRDYRTALRAAQAAILGLIDEDIRRVAGKSWPGLKVTGLSAAVIGKVGVGVK